MKPSKELILTLLDHWIRQRPGLEYGNYGDPVAYRAEIRSIGKDLQHARTLLRAVELSGISADELIAAFGNAYSGRLSLVERKMKDGYTGWALDYCTGQYWPTEYRRAACAVLASALWNYKRDKCMPAPEYVTGDGRTFSNMAEASGHATTLAPVIVSIETRYKGMRAGDWMRRSFTREYGRGIANRWFN